MTGGEHPLEGARLLRPLRAGPIVQGDHCQIAVHAFLQDRPLPQARVCAREGVLPAGEAG